MTRTEAKLVLSKSLLGDNDPGPAEREAVMTLACGGLDDLDSIARSLARLTELAEEFVSRGRV